MRILVWLTLGLSVCCGVSAYQIPYPEWTVCVFLTAVLSPVLFLMGRKHKSCKAAALILIGFGFGSVWYQGYNAFYLQNVIALDGVTVEARIRTTDYSFETRYGSAVDGRIDVDNRSYSVRVYLDENTVLEPGSIISGKFKFRLTTPDSMDGGTGHSGKGIFLLAYQEDDVSITADAHRSFIDYTSVLRRQIKGVLSGIFAEDVYSFSIALLLGDTSALSYETDTDLKVSGIRHVAAVSGLHVSVLFALCMKIAFRKRFLSPIVGMPVLFLFAAVAGFTPSVNRACIMCELMLLALVFNREYDGMTALAFSALVMLLQNPLSITNVSFQLSCASVAGIFLFSGFLYEKMEKVLGDMQGKSTKARLKRWAAASVSTTISAMVFATPLCAFYFKTVSLVGVLTNLLTLWIISAIFYGLMLVCVLGWICPAAAMTVGKLLAAPIRLVLFIAEQMAGFPLACVYTNSVYIFVWLIFVYVVLALFLLAGKKNGLFAAGCCTVGLCLALALSWMEPLRRDTSITLMDVGQGQCILLQSEGKYFLVDCGGDSPDNAADSAAQFLLSRGIFRLDGIIVTHMDEDHMCGLQNLLHRIDTALLIVPPVRSDLLGYDGDIIYADRELNVNWSGTNLRIFGERNRESRNENSLCILLDTEKCDILITGDRNAEGEKQLLREMGTHDVDILVAGHHGAKNATSELLLQAVTPEIVCISVGEGNVYGHPSAETLTRLYQNGCQVYRTDLHGTITIGR